MSSEVWIPLPDWEHYEVSNLGNIRGPRGLRKAILNPKGYLQIALNAGSTRKTIHLHRAICIAFHGPPPFEGAMALHKDHVRTNCREDNLYWGTAQQNSDNMFEAERQSFPTGERAGNSKLTWDAVRDIRSRYAAGESQNNLAVEYGVDQTTLSLICSGKTWKESQ